jgi:tetratricopeptide (TPR) repeat protein
MALAFIVCFVAVASADLSFYLAQGGGGETQTNMFIAIVRFFLNYWAVIAGAMTYMGWFLVFVIVVVPLVLVTFKLQDLTDVQKILPLAYSCFLVFIGAVALMQSSGFSGFHFWKWEISSVRDQYMLCVSILGTSIVAMKIISVFAVDVYYRNYTRLLREMFDYDFDEEPITLTVLKSVKFSLKFLRVPVTVIPVAVLCLVIPPRFNTAVKEVSSIVNGIARQTAAEAKGINVLFTDGSYDSAVEVAAAEKGEVLKTLSLMSGSGKYDVAIRLRNETNEENISLLKTGASDTLRTWVQGNFACLSNVAIQLGFELWRHNKLAMPEIGGFIARVGGYPSGDVEKWREQARKTADEILNLHEKHDLEKLLYPELLRLFLVGQWRIARMCRMRAQEADEKKEWKLSEKESSLADKLDKSNPEWKKVQDKMTWIGFSSSMHLTPREGLKLGLDRADFRMAGSYARRVIATDPDDMNANFALGMGYFIDKLYEKAEMHLKKCLVRAPDEPAVLNNLAVIQLRLGKLDEAEKNASHALKFFPKSHEIKATLRHIKEARKELK